MTIALSLLKCKERPLTQEAMRFKKNGVWNTLSWRDYYDNVERVAGGLMSLGLQAGDKIAIWSNTRPEWAWTDIAIMSCRAITVPIYQSSLPEEVEYILNNSGATILLCETPMMAERFDRLRAKCPGIKAVICFEAQETAPQFLSWSEVLSRGEEYARKHKDFIKLSVQHIHVEDTATLVYTSGTTGVPKGVILTHEQLMSEIDDVFAVLDIFATDRSLTFLPFAHILGRVELWGHLYVGFCMAFAESVDRIRDNLPEVSPTFLIAVPRIFEKIYNGMISQAEASPAKHAVFKYAMSIGTVVSQHRLEGRPVPVAVQIQYQLVKKLVFNKLAQKLGGRVRFALCGGAPLSFEIAKFFHAADLMLLEGYGLTETTAAVAVNLPSSLKFGTVGKPLADVKIKIAADGEILVKSKKVMKGYYKNETATQEVLTDDGYFCTGDIGELTQDGYLRITDRKKDLIKTAGGKYVAPQKLENLLKLSKYVSNV
ncbi:MAG: long-chain fatty acid--CoA ligase, partial [Bdellovibrionales bacterium]|nr:long-chain fatty acid--CoA ligase [Bdellovibrionales bacterium]